MNKYVTCESVFRGHPDKVCDQISDAILDEYLLKDKDSRVAIECSIKDNLVIIFGEVTSKAHVNLEKVAKRVLRDIGYFDNFVVITKVSTQSWDIAKGVDKLGAGDQGIMYGYATNETKECLPLPYVIARDISTNETKECLPLPYVIARDISKAVENIRKEKYMDVLMPDGKCQVTVRYEDNKPKDIKTIVVSTQTKKGVKLEEVKRIIKEEVLIPLLGSTLDGIEILVNPTGAFFRGGPYADSGLTGRKLMVDTYGGVAHHGGGAFSGKDYTKVDRSGAYYVRFVAKSIVEAGLADKCEVAVSYSIGVANPISVSIDTFGTVKLSEDELLKLINDHFDFSVGNIIKELKLKDISYQRLAEYGHFGNDIYPWENVDGKVSELKKATAKAST